MTIKIKIKTTIAAVLAAQSCVGLSSLLSAVEPSPDQLEFFEKRIRPVLVESCYACHSVESGKSKGGLRLDSRDRLLKGGDSGPAIMPGKPDQSLLIKAIRYVDDDLQMPPANKGGKLAEPKLADLEAWVRMGAPDPRRDPTGAAASTAESAFAEARRHWAFQPVVAPPLPEVVNRDWIKTPVDAFVLAKLEAKSLVPARPADRRTLLRRVHFGLTGLPPDAQDVDNFMSDGSPDAFEKVVDLLLASPRYGERWGRYWLDVARYADTKGYVFQEERRYPFSYTYRDYVIKAFNDDKPYDRFLTEQIAADRLPLGGDKAALAAMGFLTLGRRFLNNENDIIDDRIDVVMRGTQGLTVGCARCHDHKFDPISSKDYYALHGVFASSHEPDEKPLLGELKDTEDYRSFRKRKAELEEKIEAKAREEVRQFLARERAKSGDYLLAAHDAVGRRKDVSLETFAGERKVEVAILRRWMSMLEERAKTHDPVLSPWLALAVLPETDFAKAAAELIASFVTAADSGESINPEIRKALADAKPASLKDVADIYGRVFARADHAWSSALDEAAKGGKPAPSSLSNPDEESIRQFLSGDRAPFELPFAEARRLIARHIDNETVGLRQQIEALNWTHPGAPARAMALVDRPDPRNSRVFIRGNPGNPGPEVPRQFLEVLERPQRQPFTNGSGRLELARAIASRDNPLTARVLVNRVWGWHFGKPLVSTPSDFGVRTERPVQLDLLNWLAATFMDQGWSIKKLHKLIVLSSTYQQSSDADSRSPELDPDNQLLHRFNRQRLDFEAMRDTLLAASGRLDSKAGGLPADLLSEPFSGRRTVYGFIDRQNLPGLLRTFDFANPDASSPGRFTTTVPQQALFMMNSPFVVQQARALVARPEIQGAGGEEAKVTAIHRLVFQRGPDGEEARLAKQFLHEPAARSEASQPVWQYGSAQFDESTKHVTYFRRFTHYTAKTGWHPEAKFPGERSGWVMVNASGGHPGAVPKLASVRRWTAPIAGVIGVTGRLKHPAQEGDGVRGRIVSSGSGLLGEWTVHAADRPTTVPRLEVEAGETVDFLVDCRGSEHYDSYVWVPTVRYLEGDLAELTHSEFNAERDFRGAEDSPSPAPLSAWERYAQVLLLSNEFAFVD